MNTIKKKILYVFFSILFVTSFAATSKQDKSIKNENRIGSVKIYGNIYVCNGWPAYCIYGGPFGPFLKK